LVQDPEAAAVGGDKFLIDGPTTITMHDKSKKGVRRGFFWTGAAI
jgi:hypothetical protein